MDVLEKLIEEKPSYCERGQLAIGMFTLYFSIKDKINYSIENFDEVISQGGVVALVPKARSIFACALRTSGVKYVDLSRYYGLTACRVTQLALAGQEHCFSYKEMLGAGEHEIRRFFKTWGLIELPFNTEEFIKEQEAFLAQARLKIRELKKERSI